METVRATGLHHDISAYIQSGTESAETFNTLALRLFARQYDLNLPYRRFCDGRGMTPANVAVWSDIPPAPASAFKHHALTCAPVEECEPVWGGRVFHSSGTTGAETSRHYMDAHALGLYRISLRAGYERFVPIPQRILALMPTPKDAPHSSLSFMLGELGAHCLDLLKFTPIIAPNDAFLKKFVTFVDELEKVIELQPKPVSHQPIPLEHDHLRLLLRDVIFSIITTSGKPQVLFGTAFAWVHLLDAMGDDTVALPEGSVIIETGGFKGRSREVSRDDLYQMFTDKLGVPETHCLSEYGMSEMASQFYDDTLYNHVHGITRPRRKVAPYWLQTRVLDPVTGQECADGISGLLAHYDLANYNSVFALQTEDMGHKMTDGEGFTLEGRAPGAVLRGCSLLAE